MGWGVPPRLVSTISRSATKSTGAGRSTTTRSHDPATYVSFAKQFQSLAAAIDPSISIGIDAAVA